MPVQNPAKDDTPIFGLPTNFERLESRSADALPRDDGKWRYEPKWQYEPKWDGFRAQAFRAGDAVDLRGKSGKPLGRYFPEVLVTLRDAPFERQAPQEQNANKRFQKNRLCGRLVLWRTLEIARDRTHVDAERKLPAGPDESHSSFARRGRRVSSPVSR